LENKYKYQEKELEIEKDFFNRSEQLLENSLVGESDVEQLCFFSLLLHKRYPQEEENI
jgi:hypothetical protein